MMPAVTEPTNHASPATSDLGLTEERREAAITEYRRYVDRMADPTSKSAPFMNRDARHAAIAIAKLFSLAEHTIAILTEKLDETVYGNDEVVTAFLRFLRKRKDGRVAILTENVDITPTHPLFSGVTDEEWARIWYGRVRNVQVPYTYNFVVTDSCSFRFEPDRAVKEAIVQFREPKIGARLHEVFGRFLELSSSSAEGSSSAA
jgi:hypothetical protein